MFGKTKKQNGEQCTIIFLDAVYSFGVLFARICFLVLYVANFVRFEKFATAVYSTSFHEISRSLIQTINVIVQL